MSTLPTLTQMQAEIMTVWSDEVEVDTVNPGANVKLKLKNVEEDVSCTPLFTSLLTSLLTLLYIFIYPF